MCLCLLAGERVPVGEPVLRAGEWPGDLRIDASIEYAMSALRGMSRAKCASNTQNGQHQQRVKFTRTLHNTKHINQQQQKSVMHMLVIHAEQAAYQWMAQQR